MNYTQKPEFYFFMNTGFECYQWNQTHRRISLLKTNLGFLQAVRVSSRLFSLSLRCCDESAPHISIKIYDGLKTLTLLMVFKYKKLNYFQTNESSLNYKTAKAAGRSDRLLWTLCVNKHDTHQLGNNNKK